MVAEGEAADLPEAYEIVKGRNERQHQKLVEQALKRGKSEEAAFESANRQMGAQGFTRGTSGYWVRAGKTIHTDPAAAAIRDDKTLSVEQKRSKLRELGYQERGAA